MCLTDWPDYLIDLFRFPTRATIDTIVPPFLFSEAIEAAINIRQIAKLACNRGCKIRFFQFGQKVGGGIDRLVPVNSEEMESTFSREIDALSFLSLTVQNKQSLVFYSPEKENEPAVLFTADSDLNFSLPDRRPYSVPIVTSPHHGAEANKNAYSTVSRWLNDSEAIWIRSDKACEKRPGVEYKKQKKRICTLCNSGDMPKQTVKMNSVKWRWQPTKGTRWCSCK